MVKLIMGIILLVFAGLFCFITIRTKKSNHYFEASDTMKATVVGEKKSKRGRVKQYQLALSVPGQKKQYVLSEPCTVTTESGTILNGTSVLVSLSSPHKDGRQSVRVIDKRYVKEVSLAAWIVFAVAGAVAAAGAIALFLIYFL